MSPSQVITFPLALAVSLPALAAQTAPPPPVRFKVLVLESHAATSNAGNEEARCINAAGETAGQVLVTNGMHAARWSANGALTDLGITGGCTFSSANGISETGAVVGASLQGAPDNAFLWTPSGGTTQLALPFNCYPAAVLDDGSIAFTAIFSGQQPLGVLWHPGVSNHRIIAAGSGDVFVRDLSPSGSVAGHAGYPGVGNRAFRWTQHLGLVDLDPPAGFTDCTAYGIDDEGAVVGVSTAVGIDQPTIWDASGVGTPLPFARSTSTQATAFAVNGNGWVVGYEFDSVSARPFAVLWVAGTAYELTSLLKVKPGDPPVKAVIGWDVNAKGQIAARGIVGGVERALRLDPF